MNTPDSYPELCKPCPTFKTFRDDFYSGEGKYRECKIELKYRKNCPCPTCLKMVMCNIPCHDFDLCIDGKYINHCEKVT